MTHQHVGEQREGRGRQEARCHPTCTAVGLQRRHHISAAGGEDGEGRWLAGWIVSCHSPSAA